MKLLFSDKADIKIHPDTEFHNYETDDGYYFENIKGHISLTKSEYSDFFNNKESDVYIIEYGFVCSFKSEKDKNAIDLIKIPLIAFYKSDSEAIRSAINLFDLFVLDISKDILECGELDHKVLTDWLDKFNKYVKEQ